MRHAAMLWGNVKRELGKFLTKVFVGGSLTGIGTEADPIELKGDAESPGNKKYYGTDGSGNKGYHNLPEGGGGGTPLTIQLTPPAVTLPQLAQGTIDYQNAETRVKIFKDGLEAFPNWDEGLGGENLLLNSDFKGETDTWQANGVANISMDNDYLKVEITGTTSTPGLRSIDNYLTLETGIYTFTVRANLENFSKRFRLPSLTTGVNVDLQNLFERVGFETVSVTFEITEKQEDKYFYLITSNPKLGEYFLIDWMKLEKHDSFSGWSPNPLDLINYIEITPQNTDYEIDNDKITLKNITKNTGYLDLETSWRDETAKARFNFSLAQDGESYSGLNLFPENLILKKDKSGIIDLSTKVKIEAILDGSELFPETSDKIEEVNLLLNSKNEKSGKYIVTDYTLTEAGQDGETYTFSAKIKISDSDNKRFMLYNTGTVKQLFSVTDNNITYDEWFFVIKTFTWQNQGSNSYVRLLLGNNNDITNYVRDAKLVKGYSENTEWTPVPIEAITLTPHNCTAEIEDKELKLLTVTDDKGWVDVDFDYSEDFHHVRRLHWQVVEDGQDGKDGEDCTVAGYKWNLKGKGVLPEISNIQIIQDADSGDYDEIENQFFISAFNVNGETIPQPVPLFKWYEESEEIVILWDEIEGATGYRFYVLEEDGSFSFWNFSNNYADLNTDFDESDGQVFSLPIKNTAFIDASVQVKDNDTVEFKSDDADITVFESQDEKTKTVKFDINFSVPESEKTRWNIGTGNGLENVKGLKLIQETLPFYVKVLKHLYVSAYNSEGETLPLPVVDVFKMKESGTGGQIGIVNWEKLDDANGYYFYIGISIHNIETNLFEADSWFKYDIDDNNITEIDLQNLSSYSHVQVSEIPTENTTGFSEFRIEHEDLLEIEGDGIDVELTTDGRRKKLKLTAAGGGGGSFDITDGTETVSIDPDDQITLVGDGVEIEVSEDEQDSTKKEIKLTADAEKITEIIQTETDKNKTSYLYDKYEDENLTHETGWTVEEWTEKVGHLKAVVSVFDIDEQTLVTLQNTMSYDFLSGGFKADNKIIKDGNDEITLDLDVDDKKLIAVIEGMSENSKRIFLCFERCFDGIEVIPANVEYGLLYNWFAIVSNKKISSNDNFVVPSYADVGNLRTYLNDDVLTVKKEGGIYWTTDNGVNTYEFNAKGTGRRSPYDGTYIGLKNLWEIWTSTEYVHDNTQSWSFSFPDNRVVFSRDPRPKQEGFPTRLVNHNTLLNNGEKGEYVGNDGKLYPTICINGSEWLAENLSETKYRDGSLIPEITDDEEWTELETDALCVYDNDWDNA